MEKRSNSKTRKTKQTGKTINIRYQFNPNHQRTKGEKNTLPSQTIPDMSLTCKELLLNHSRGISSNVHNYDPQYFDTEIPRFDDIVEEKQYKEDLAEKIKEVDERIKKRKADAAKKAKEEKRQSDAPVPPLPSPEDPEPNEA